MILLELRVGGSSFAAYELLCQAGQSQAAKLLSPTGEHNEFF